MTRHPADRGLVGLWRRRSLATRTAVVTTILVATLTAALTWISVRRERQTFRGELEQLASAVLETLAISSRGLLFRLDSEGLAGIAEQLTSTGLLLEVSFYGEHGRLVASSAGAMTTLEPDSLGTRLTELRRPIRSWGADRLIAGQTIEVADTVLGAASVEISTRPMLAKVRAVQVQGTVVALVACILGIAAAQFFSRTITRPLEELSATAKRIGGGDLDLSIPSRPGRDEITVLAGSLEEMRVDLKMLYSMLEGEVAQRTRELEATNKALQSTNQELEAKAAELEQFAYTISHDLKSPLITINSFLGYIRESAEQGDMERLQEDLQRISTAATHMRRLLDELLGLSRIGRIANAPEPVDLESLAREAVAHVGADLGDSTIEVNMAPDLAPAYGDRVRLLEVFDNLVENAVKHAGADAAKIEISSRRQGDEVLTCIADNGIGIDPAHQGKIFELFTKLDPAAEGSGIGLAIVKRIVEVHGGRIWVESPGTGGGTTFCFSLPTPPPDQGSEA